MDRMELECLEQINAIRDRHHAPLLDEMPTPMIGCPIIAALADSPQVTHGSMRWGLGGTLRWWRPTGNYVVLHPHPALTRYRDAQPG